MLSLKWEPKLLSPAEVEIPVVLLACAADSHEQWPLAQQRWHESKQADPPWDRCFAFAESGRIQLRTGGQASQGLAEFYTALQFEELGFEWWTSVPMFDYGYEPSDRSQRKRDEVRRRWSETLGTTPWPAEIQKQLTGPPPKNPDLVAYHPQRNEWRFCEAKRWRDPIREGQLTGLAILHLLTRAPVAVVQLVPDGRQPKQRMSHRVSVQWRAGTSVPSATT